MCDIKAIALDLDGTLVGDNHYVSENNRRAIWHAAQKGVTILLTSGRPYASVRKIAEEIGLSELGGYMVSYNGAHVTDAKTGQILFLKTVPQGTLKRLEALLGEWKQAELFAYNDSSMLLTAKDHPYGSKIAEGLRLPIEVLPDFSAAHQKEFCKFVVAGERALLREIYGQLKITFSKDVCCIYGGGNFIEIMPTGVTKATGTAAVLQKCGIVPKQLMCCGDSENDLAMMQYAGRPVAMGNATADVKAYARYTTGRYDEDGVAQAIYHITGLPS